MARPMRTFFCLSISLSFLLAPLLAGPAHAALPDAAKLMITKAAREGAAGELDAVVNVARKSFPEDSAEIDQLVLSLKSPQGLPVAATAEAKAAEPEKPAIKWSGRGDLGGFHTSGNTDSFGITLGGTLTRKGESVTHQLRLRGDYQESAGKKSREYANAAWQMDWKISDAHYALGIAEYERDVLAGIRHRSTTSLGLGWKAVASDEVKISVEAGPAYRYEWLAGGVEKDNLAGRGALNSWWQVNDKVKLSQDMELIAQSSNNTLRSITALQAKLTGRISSQLSYDLRYQDKPLIGKENTDTITRVGLVYDF